MSLWDDLEEAASDGLDALGDGVEAVVDAVDSAIDEGEEAIDDATEEFAEWFMEEILGAFEDYINFGGSEVDTPDTEQYESTQSTRSLLQAAHLIEYEYAREYGTDNDTLTLLPSRFTSRLVDTDEHDRDLDGVRPVADGAIGAIDELTTESDAAPRRTSGRSENRDADTTSQTLDEARDDDAVSFADGQTSSERQGAATVERETETTTSQFSTAVSDSLQFIATADDASGTTDDLVTERDAPTTTSPIWTNYNDSDPSIAVVDGSWMDDVRYTVDDDRGSRQRESASFVETDSAPTHLDFATTLEDASPTLSMSWLF